MWKKLTFSPEVKKVRKSPLEHMSYYTGLAAKDPEIISFGAGAPSLLPPKGLMKGMEELIEKEPKRFYAYTHVPGDESVRQEIIKDLKKEGPKVDLDELVITTGGTEALFATFFTLLNPGEEVVLMNPTYVGYPEPIEMMRAKPRFLKATWKENFQPDVEKLKEMINRKTEAVLMLSPDNPTGRVLDKKVAKAIADLAEDHKFWIISDDVYKNIIYEGEHVFFRKYTNRVISVNSLSKEASIPGLRMGYVYGPREIIKNIVKAKQYISLCPPSPAQRAAYLFYRNKLKKKYLEKTVIPTYRKRRDFMEAMLRKYLPEAGFVRPQGAFYFFVDLSKYFRRKRLDDGSFADLLFRKRKVVVIPGNYFGSAGKSHVRMTFVSEDAERTEQGIRAMAEVLK